MKKVIITTIATLIVLINLLPDTLIGFDYRIPVKLISWNTGIVTTAEGDGTITSPFADDYYNYIKYEEGTPVGSTVFTIYIYNPLTLYSDDVIARYDF